MYNATLGHLNDEDGYDCKLCMNRGNIGAVSEKNGMVYESYPECKCMAIRRSIWRMKRSGLENSIRECTFEKFEVREPWQQTMIDTAKRYLAEGVKDGHWLYYGGQSGSGKSMICTAVARQLLYERPLLYIVWPQTAKKLKALVGDAETYERAVGRLQNIDVLYIDDLFKPVMGRDGSVERPTAPDLRLAFEVLNYRYIGRKPTIISSEWHLIELNDMDEATASRIAERSNGYCVTIGRDRKKNHRFSGEEVV